MNDGDPKIKIEEKQDNHKNGDDTKNHGNFAKGHGAIKWNLACDLLQHQYSCYVYTCIVH